MNVAQRPQHLDILSICTGGGGLDLGIGLAVPGARPVVLVEREAFAVAHLVAAMEQGLLHPAPVWSDARTFDGRRWRGCVDGLIGGIPCQPHSLAGRKRGSLDERDLWSDARRIVVQSRCWFVLIENVGGMLSAGADEIAGAERVWRDLRKLGFQVEIGLFTAAEVGASHERERVFILGVADATDGGREHGPGRTSIRGGESGQFAIPESCNSGEELADAYSERLEGQRPDAGEVGWQDAGRSAGLCDGADVVVAPRIGWREGRTEPEFRRGRDTAARAGQPVVHAERLKRRAVAGSGHPFDAGQQPEPGRGTLDDTLGGRRSARRDDHGCDVGDQPDAAGEHVLVNTACQRGRKGGALAAGGKLAGRIDADGAGSRHGSLHFGEHLADTDRNEPPPQRRDAGEMPGGPEGEGGPEHGSALSGGGGLPAFPPGPGDIEGWRAVLARAPELEPAFRRMADGLASRLDAHRVDRLRMLGNGVVPLQAAHALRTLCHRLAGRGSRGAAELMGMMEAAE